MTNEEFIELLNIYSVNSIIRFDIVAHAKKLVSVAEAAKKFMIIKDTDDMWPHVYEALESALENLERE